MTNTEFSTSPLIPLILIVDDSSIVRQIIKKQLIQENYNVITLSSGKEALEYLQKQASPDLILLDVMMPEMNGFETCKKIKNNKKTSKIPVIFLTGKDKKEGFKEGKKYGAVDIIQKTTETEDIPNRIKKFLPANLSAEKNSETEIELKKIQTQLELILENVDLGIWELNLRDKKISFSHHFEKTLGYNETTWSLYNLKNIIHSNDKNKFITAVNDLINKKVTTISTLQQIKSVSGKWHSIKLNGKIISQNGEQESIVATGIFRDFTNQEKATKKSTKSNTNTKINLNNILTKILPSIKKQLKQKKISLQLKKSDDPLFISGKPKDIELIFLHLFQNSIESLDQSNHLKKIISVKIFKRKDKVYLYFIDNGIGIPKKNISKIFDASFSTKEKDKSSGMGLTIINKIIFELKGNIHCESSEDTKTIFKINFPAIEE